jgi:hypothetical protein
MPHIIESSTAKELKASRYHQVYEIVTRDLRKKQRTVWENCDRVSELISWSCVHDICTSLLSESSGGEHGTVSSDYHESVVPAIISCVVPK